MKTLIIGQGIAGSVLAWHLMKDGAEVLIVDNQHQSSSSIVSAGIINPITGQRLAQTPQFDLFFAHAMKTYSQMSVELNENFFIPKPIIRVLRSSEELARCQHLNATDAAKPFIKGIHPSGFYGKDIFDPWGTLTISQGGYLRTQLLLTRLRKFFAEKNMLINEQFSYDDLKLSEHHVQWKSQTFDAVIFCEGFKAKENPWFKDLPYNFAKGEILKIAFDSACLPDAILCQQQWCLPAEDGTYLAGSTYDRLNINTTATLEGETEILQGLKSFLAAKVRVLERFAAVRPVMLDQKPLMGMHPEMPRLGILNGFASKGILWAPYYAEMLAEKLKTLFAPSTTLKLSP